MIGKKFGRLEIIGDSGKRSKNRQIMWDCICTCGKRVLVRSDSLKSGNTKSCGCLNVDSHTTHGLTNSETYNTYRNMIRRCYEESSINYSDYGGRGIRVCDHWMKSFQNFLKDMGLRPSNKTLDRIDNNGNYTPENCKWSTLKEQCKNRRPIILSKNDVISIRKKLNNGTDMRYLSYQFGVSYTTIYDIKKGRTWKGISDGTNF